MTVCAGEIAELRNGLDAIKSDRQKVTGLYY